MCHNCLGHADRHDVDRRQAPVTDAPAAPVATGKPLQDASNLPDLSHQQTAEVARKARRAQHKRDVRAAMSEQQAEAVRATDARAHKKSRSVRYKVPAAAAGCAAQSMTVMATLFGSSSAAAAAAAQHPQQVIGPQPSATSASGHIPPTTLPQAIAPLPAVPNMTSVNLNQRIMHDPSHAPVQQHPSALQPFPPVPADPNMTGSTQGSMQPPLLSAQVPDREPAEPQRLTWLHVGAAKRTALRQPARPPAPRIPSMNPEDQLPHSPHSTTIYAADLYCLHPAIQRQQRRLDYEVSLAMQRPETPVTEHEVADMVQHFPDDSVS